MYYQEQHMRAGRVARRQSTVTRTRSGRQAEHAGRASTRRRPRHAAASSPRPHRARLCLVGALAVGVVAIALFAIQQQGELEARQQRVAELEAQLAGQHSKHTAEAARYRRALDQQRNEAREQHALLASTRNRVDALEQQLFNDQEQLEGRLRNVRAQCRATRTAGASEARQKRVRSPKGRGPLLLSREECWKSNDPLCGVLDG